MGQILVRMDSGIIADGSTLNNLTSEPRSCLPDSALRATPAVLAPFQIRVGLKSNMGVWLGLPSQTGLVNLSSVYKRQRKALISLFFWYDFTANIQSPCILQCALSSIYLETSYERKSLPFVRFSWVWVNYFSCLTKFSKTNLEMLWLVHKGTFEKSNYHTCVATFFPLTGMRIFGELIILKDQLLLLHQIELFHKCHKWASYNMSPKTWTHAAGEVNCSPNHLGEDTWAKIIWPNFYIYNYIFVTIRQKKRVINLSTNQNGWKTLVHNDGDTTRVLKCFIFSGVLGWIIKFIVAFKFDFLKIESMLYLSSGLSKDRVDVEKYTKFEIYKMFWPTNGLVLFQQHCNLFQIPNKNRT